MATIPQQPQPATSPSLLRKLTDKIGKLLADEVEQPTMIGTAVAARQTGNPWESYASMSAWAFQRMKVDAGRIAAYRDYDAMDAEVPEVATALDIIAEFATQSDDEKAETFRIECEDEALRKYLDDKVKQLKLDKLCTPAAREVVKYGCTYLELIADAGGQIVASQPLPPTTMLRKENKWGQLESPAFEQLSEDGTGLVAKFEAWQIVHTRMRKQLSRIYGNSHLESARRVFKQLQLMEDGVVVGRLYRSHLRYVFMVPIEGLKQEEGDAYIDKLRRKFKKKSRYNQATGKIESTDSPMTAEEDFWIGQRKDTPPGDVKVLQGSGNLGQLQDIEHFQNKLFTNLKVPKALMAVERDVNAKATLTEQDIHFARMLRRLQQVMAEEFVGESLRRAMILDGYDPDATEWSVVFPPISTRDEQAEWQTNANKATFVKTMYGELKVIDEQFIFERVLELSPEDQERLKKFIEEKKKEQEALQAQQMAQQQQGREVEQADKQAQRDHEVNLTKLKMGNKPAEEKPAFMREQLEEFIAALLASRKEEAAAPVINVTPQITVQPQPMDVNVKLDTEELRSPAKHVIFERDEDGAIKGARVVHDGTGE